ncbi:MAG: carbon starvation protein A [Thermodesulfobacteriota bacterium]
MNSLAVTAVVLVWFVLMYKLYGSFIVKKLVQPDDTRQTPAHTHEDDVDFVPAKTYLLWGNHFSSIAGAGPIIGPILAVSLFGWGYTVLWVALGAVFLGAVHDTLSLMISVRHDGKGMSELAGMLLGPTMRYAFAALVYFMLMLLVTVFMVSVAQALVNMPALVIPTFGLVGVAIVMGLAVHRLHANEVIVSALGILTAYALIWVGYAFPLSLPASLGPKGVMAVWCLIITAYCLLAADAPMWLLLQPRDFISSVKLLVGMALGFAGILFIHPVLSAPFGPESFAPQGKPVWPILFIMVACGAISGFHSLVASGTTARQLSRESDGKIIAFGGMITEGALALLVTMLVAGGLKWGSAPAGVTGDAANLYFQTALAKNWIVAFGHGFGHLVGALHIPLVTAPIAALLGAVMVKSFILTTLDTGTRLGRYLITETFGQRYPILQKRAVASLLMLAPAFALAVTNAYGNVWKLFGTANQLLAAVALITVSVFLVKEKKPRAYTLVPALFMIATTLCALLWEMFHPEGGYLVGAKPELLLGGVALVLTGLGLGVALRGGKELVTKGENKN